MSSTSAMACSFTPGDRQPRRSNARIRMSRSDSPDIRPSSQVHSRPYSRRGGVPGRAADVRSRVVTRFLYLSFLTDYGLEDGFVAACHGVGAAIAPHADIIDVTHLIPPGDVRRGAAVLAQTVPYLPPAVHVAVVDPGVGTARRGAARAFTLTNSTLWLSQVTPTFHGRDIFMPVAAHLAADAELAAAGEEIDVAGLATLPAPERTGRPFTAAGEV